jgi:hypothetical protein
MADKPKRYWKARQVRERYGGISDMTLRRWIRHPTMGFPQPVKPGKENLFLDSELEKFDRQAAARKHLPPTNTDSTSITAAHVCQRRKEFAMNATNTRQGDVSVNTAGSSPLSSDLIFQKLDLSDDVDRLWLEYFLSGVYKIRASIDALGILDPHKQSHQIFSFGCALAVWQWRRGELPLRDAVNIAYAYAKDFCAPNQQGLLALACDHRQPPRGVVRDLGDDAVQRIMAIVFDRREA